MGKFIVELKNEINKNSNHILFKNKNSNYYRDFFNSFKYIQGSIDLNNNKQWKNFKNRLQLMGNYNEFVYLQNISEIMLWILCLRNKFDFHLEKKMSIENNTDVDVQIIKDGVTFNIEVKCPQFDIRKESVLNLQNAFRTTSKKQTDYTLKIIKEDISKNSDTEDTIYNEISISKMHDNKLVDYLKSGHKKFPDVSDGMLNIVMVSVRSTDMQSYWEYLFNGYSGLFTDKSFCNINEYSKVDAVLLTNMLEGHCNPSEEYDAWNLENYCNLLCLNPRNIYNGKLSNKHKVFLDNFPNSTCQFEEYYLKFLKSIEKELAPDLELLLFPHYMDEYYPLQWKR